MEQAEGSRLLATTRAGCTPVDSTPKERQAYIESKLCQSHRHKVCTEASCEEQGIVNEKGVAQYADHCLEDPNQVNGVQQSFHLTILQENGCGL